MADTTLFRLGQRRAAAEALGERAEAWRRDHDEAMEVRDLEDLIADAVALAADLNRLARVLHDRLGRNQVNEPLRVGEALRTVLDYAGRMCRLFLDDAAEAEGRGYTVAGADELKAAVARLDATGRWLCQAWPVVGELFDPAELEASLAEADAGQLRTHAEVWGQARPPA